MSTPRTDPAATVTKLGYVGFETPDIDAMVDYYTKNLDFVVVDAGAEYAYLTTGSEHHNVVLQKTSAPRGRTFVGWQIEESLDDAERRMRERGYETERRRDIGPGSPDTLILTEPGTQTPLHLFSEIDAVEVPRSWLRPTKLGHVASFVPDLDKAQSFYEDLLGFRWSDTIGDFFVFMRCGRDHHTANFLKSSSFKDLHHIAYEARDLNHLQMMLDSLASNEFRLEWGPGRHGAGHNVFTYHKDPDGNMVELFTQLDQIADEDKGYFEPRPWHEDSPQYPKTWEVDVAAANNWGPINPALMEH
ncbi:VOC family protein [Tsukamurella spumae]|uniref:Glyoxalase n=1 Tax=Tsukamurella spumae TaxID=44753 RepID=A0A846X2D2_9ACTN|nr:VOC family protein [Tsukamurella spumae]NKY19777.1 glyoxalase [Tsukamurella spumae]